MAARYQNGQPSLPLEGVRVVAITQAWAGPYAGTLLADWGAEVIQVESRERFPVGTRGLVVDGKGVVPEKERMWSRGYPDWDGGERPWNRYVGFNPGGGPGTAARSRVDFGCRAGEQPTLDVE